MRFAGFNIRSAAYTIDGFAVIALTYLAYYAMGGDAHAAGGMEDIAQQLQAAAAQTQQGDPYAAFRMMLDMSSDGPSLTLATIVSALYNIGFGVSGWHGTPGKHWRGLKIVMEDGSPLTLKASVIRHAATGISTILCFAGFFMVAWTKQKTALHDMIAGTRVIYREAV